MANTGVSVLTNVPWAIGQTVPIYPRISDQVLPDLPPTGVAPVASAVVAANQSLTYGPGTEDGEYWAVAPLTPGQRDYRYIGLSLQTPPPVMIPGPVGPTGPVGPPGPTIVIDQMRVNVNQPAGFVAATPAKAVFGARVSHGDAGQYTLQGTGNNAIKIRDAGVYAITALTSGIGAARHVHTLYVGSYSGFDADSGRCNQAGDASPSASTTVLWAAAANDIVQLDVLTETLAVVRGSLMIARLGP